MVGVFAILFSFCGLIDTRVIKKRDINAMREALTDGKGKNFDEKDQMLMD